MNAPQRLVVLQTRSELALATPTTLATNTRR